MMKKSMVFRSIAMESGANKIGASTQIIALIAWPDSTARQFVFVFSETDPVSGSIANDIMFAASSKNFSVIDRLRLDASSAASEIKHELIVGCLGSPSCEKPALKHKHWNFLCRPMLNSRDKWPSALVNDARPYSAERLSPEGGARGDLPTSRGDLVVEEPDHIPFAAIRTAPPSFIAHAPDASSRENSTADISPPVPRRCATVSTWIIVSLAVLVVVLSVLLVINSEGPRVNNNEPLVPTQPSPPPPPMVTDISDYTTLHPTDLNFSDWFGCSVAIHRGVLVVGAPLKRVNDTKTGAVYVFRKSDSDEWREEQTLVPQDRAERSRFGRSVAVYEDRIIVGAYFDGDQSGSAYVFVYENGRWREEQKLVASDASKENLFGISVAIHDGLVVVGASKGNNGTGCVYIFARHDGAWLQRSKLVPGQPDSSVSPPYESFGSSLAMNEIGRTLIIGSKEIGELQSDCVSVYIATLDGNWAEIEKLPLTDDEPGDDFGRSVAIHGDTIVVGIAGRDRSSIHNAGGVFSFGPKDFESWAMEQAMWLESPRPSSKFGHWVAVNDRYLVATSRYGGEGRMSTAHAYIRVNNEWQPKYNLVTEGDLRRAIVAMEDDTLVLGSTYGSSPVGKKTGAVYMFRLPQF